MDDIRLLEVKVLLVEDRPEERVALQRQLGLSKVNAVIVGEAGVDSEALTMMEGLRPDVVLLGLEEPLARPLRILESLTVAGTAPVIAVSSIGDREALRKAMRAGAREYLVKPLKLEDLTKTIDTIIAVERRRRLLLSRGPGTGTLGEVIAVLGAKGGVGKTTLATNLAVALAQETRRRVGVLDLNLEMGDVPIMLDIVPEKTIGDVLGVIDRLDPELLKRFLSSHPSGVQVLSSTGEFKHMNGTTNDEIGRIVEIMAKSFDYVVVDTAPRLRGTFPSVLERSNMVLVVSTPDIPCLKNTRMMLDMLKSQRSYSDKVKLVLNNPYKASGVKPDEAGKVLDYPVFWRVPYDSLVPQCIKVGKPCLE
ncbi:MAG: AAA family ATPase, partial [Bacteroidetes bacterium]|nr:AAA family ATPase [Bacteroidota bacterium]